MKDIRTKQIGCAEIILVPLLLAAALWAVVTQPEHGVLVFFVALGLILIVHVTK